MKKQEEKDIEKYKKRLMSGESDISAKSGLKTFTKKENEWVKWIITNDGEKFPIRITDFVCPKCKESLYDIKLDGENYYCDKCKKQINLNDISNLTDD